MSGFKMPEPVGATYTIAGIQHCSLTVSGPDTDLHTADQLRQALIDALEMAAIRCEKFGKTLEHDDGGNYAEEIRALKEQIK